MSAFVICLGGINHDRTLRLVGAPVAGASNRVTVSVDAGGVARNVAEMLARLGVRVQLFGTVGDDPPGRAVVAQTKAARVEVGGVLVRAEGQTGGYTAVLDPQGELFIGLADLAATEALTPKMLAPLLAKAGNADLLFADTNLAPETLAWLISKYAGVCALAIDLVSPEKAQRLAGKLAGVAMVFGNRQEAAALMGVEGDAKELAAAIVHSGAGRAVITDGPGAIAYADAGEQHLLVPPPVEPADVSGAGDALIAGFLAAHLAGRPPRAALELGLAAARVTVAVPGRVAQNLTLKRLQKTVQTGED
ncbi:MAG: PfkB family carbohydrate kinase [Alphaproteobacteria bacterium]